MTRRLHRGVNATGWVYDKSRRQRGVGQGGQAEPRERGQSVVGMWEASKRGRLQVGGCGSLAQSARVKRNLRRRLSKATMLYKAAPSRGIDEPPWQIAKVRL